MNSDRNNLEVLKHLIDHTNLPLSSNQKRLWIIYKQDKFNPAYNLTLTYQLKGDFNPEVFRKSMEILFYKQLTMFSVFKHKECNPYIEIIQRPVIIGLIDFSFLPAGKRNLAVQSFVGEDSRKCFDIEKGPLYRLYLLKQDDTNYVFHATIHHLIFDGWSMRIFIQELSRIYNNLINGTDEKPEPLIYQSYDFASSEGRSGLKNDEEAMIEFWKENLKDCPSDLKFPYDYPRTNSSTGFGIREHILIPDTTTTKLKELCKTADTSLFKVLLSVLGVLFQKYSGENDICIGFPVSTRRRHPYSENLFGLFVNTSVVRLKIEEDISFKDLISYTKDVADKAIENAKLPFDKIVSAVNPERRSDLNPLFQVALSWWNNVIVPMDLNGNRSERISIPEGVSPIDITFYLWEEGNHIRGELEYNVDLLKNETVIRLKNSFIKLVENLTQNPDTPINSIPVITEEEINQILGFTMTQNDYPGDKTIIELFEEQVDLYPDKTAVVFKETALTYKKLDHKKNQLACTLKDIGVGRNTPVGILAEKSLDVIVGILGILKSGGIYVPIDPGYPEERINFIIKDSGCKVLVTQDQFIKSNIDGIRKISLNSPDTFNEEISDIENINSSADLAYIMYTSGTTGIPKGTVIPQTGVIRLVRNTNFIELTAEDRILLAGAIVFDASTFDIWGALLNGGTLYIAEKETILDPLILGEELLKNEITILALASSLFTQIAEYSTDIFYRLKYLFVGGDVLSAPHINKVRKDNPHLIVINAYGPTENSCMSTYYRIEKDFDNNIPIGKPISNSTAYIFDKNMNYQPIGVIGELYVGGDGLSTGYLNREDLNKTSFINHPHILGERIYRTGDYARWLPDGNIEFHGRIDNQLKIRGFRVELGEIESVISDIDGVIETVIKPVKVEEGDYRLIAFLNVSETFKMETNEIVRRIKAKLPSYMVPSAFKFMNGFPKTINGKIDKNALQSDNDKIVDRDSQELRTPTQNERKILDIWSEVLKTKDILITDNFFEIGGNSLLAISVMSKIESAFDIELGLRLFFDSPKVMDLAEAVEIKRHFLVEGILKDKMANIDSIIINGEI